MAPILVVDDSAVNRDMLARRLQREGGYEVLTAASGAECLVVLEQQAVSLVLLDLMMPLMSGLEVLERVRATRSASELPILMVSANTDSPQMVAALDVGANDYLTKPVDFPLLLAKVRRHLALCAPRVPAGLGGSMGHYEIGALLGQGGMGSVYRARDTRLLRDVALKVIPGTRDRETLSRFLQEGRAIARVSHPNIVQVYDVGEAPQPYLAMELVPGGSLDQVAQGPVGVPVAVDWILQVLSGLEAVHASGILHRDLKPANIMLTPEGRIKVMDFGLAKVVELDLQLTQTGQMWGTPRYMAPETVNPELGEADAQTDLFSVAVIFYELLTGVPPFAGASAGKLFVEILTREPDASLLPAEVRDVVMRGLAKAKSERFLTAAAFAAALRG